MSEWIMIYEEYSEGVELIYGAVQAYLEYSLPCTDQSDEQMLSGCNYIEIKEEKDLTGYRIRVGQNPRNSAYQRILITACDQVNLLYAAADFKNKYLPYAKCADMTGPTYYFYRLFHDPMKEWDRTFAPRIQHRGLWTWGFVMLDYRKYIDRMAALRLNTLILWNDTPPVNIQEVISYAHKRGVSVYLGYAWGWDNRCAENKSVAAHMSRLKQLQEQVLQTYETQYAKIGCDGIYFQSFTEATTEEIGGIPVAETVTRFVNDTAAAFLERFGDVKLLFGLHAGSVRTKLSVIAKVDSRVSIIWEDCGAFPYDYIPKNIDGFSETEEFTKKIQALRKQGGFGVVLKGLTCLDWSSFRHQQGAFVLGAENERHLEKKAEEKREIWRYVQARWLQNARYAYEMIRLFDEQAMVTILAEDGAMEHRIPYPLALYAEMLWDSGRPLDEIVYETAMREDIIFY